MHVNNDRKKNIWRAVVVLLLVGGAIVFVLKNPMFGTTAIYKEGTAPNSIPAGVPASDPQSVSQMVSEEKTGREYVSNQIIVEFAPEVSEEESLRIIAGVGGKMLQRFTEAPLFLIQVKDTGNGKGAAIAIANLTKNPQVKKAELNYLTTLETNPKP